MKQYDIRSETPLKFHKFVWYVTLPFGMMGILADRLSELSDLASFNWIYGIVAAVSLILFGLMLVAFIGFFRWRYYAWLSLMIFFAVMVAFGVLSIAVFAVYIPEQIGIGIGQLIATLIYTVPVVIYYLKRRPLFTSKAAVPVQAPRRLR